MSKQKP